MKVQARLLRLETNQQGRDFVVGDIHGHVSKLMGQLDQLQFNPDSDRVICVGDLIDRGPESPQALALLDQPWFYSVLGNHEYLMVCAMKYKHSEHRMTWLTHGGDWIAQTSPNDWPAWFETIEQLPLAIEVSGKSGTRYGIIHAEYPFTHWDDLEQLDDDEALRTIWSRTQFQQRSEHVIDGIDVVIHGHNISDGELHLGNRIYIEPGVYQGKDFIIKEL
ncbi:metallophosphoesterase [Oceanobacter sp. 3_MG-2023]|uniref:metallophosphoesterase n=1 Tax=Oceanobacter sp. 3_MG-2023 TaxID=3062622 RepID=UPI002736BCFA|nr:metallophosphoesterase [Oceanobacter sp. 3_MG-2023]MDP2505028.1 metallophosphoesterase [Oceanobacter sp. 3_MG-2023]